MRRPPSTLNRFIDTDQYRDQHRHRHQARAPLLAREEGHDERHHLIGRVHGYHGTHGFGTSLAGIPPNRESLGSLVEDVSIVDNADAGVGHGRASIREAVSRRRSSSGLFDLR